MQLFEVGEYTDTFNKLTGQELPCGPIYQSVGLRVHIMKRHPDEIDNIGLVPAIISQPDYIGKNPNEPNSIELVKALGANVMVCIKLDVNDGYLFVASVFEISESKLRRRLNSGRLKVVDKT